MCEYQNIPVDQLCTPDFASHLYALREPFKLNISAVLDLKLLEETPFAVSPVCEVTRCLVKQVAQFIAQFIDVENHMRLRKIVDARLEVLGQSIQTCIHQSMFRMPYVDKQINNTVFYSYGQNIFAPRAADLPR